MRTAEQIMNDVAKAKLLVTPLQPHASLGPDFVVACIAARDAEWRAEPKQSIQKPERARSERE